MMQAMKKATPARSFRKHRPRPRATYDEGLAAAGYDEGKNAGYAEGEKKQAMRPEKPRVLPLDTIGATPREKQQPPRKPAYSSQGTGTQNAGEVKRRALRFM